MRHNIFNIAMLSYHLKSNNQQNMIWLQQGSNYNLTNNSLSFCVSDDQLIKSFKYMQVETQNDAYIVKEPNTIKVINGKEVHSLSHCLYLTYLKSNIHNRGRRCPSFVSTHSGSWKSAKIYLFNMQEVLFLYLSTSEMYSANVQYIPEFREIPFYFQFK